MTRTLNDKKILLIISGGIAAYKALELIRLIKKAGGSTRAILTKGGTQFVTPLSVSALCEEEVYTDLWSLKDETDMGHIRLSRDADCIVIAPASADIIAKMAHGLANDLASTTLLASDKPALIAPAMNVRMWENPATQENIARLQEWGHTIIGPNEGKMACGEFGIGRMSEPEAILKAVKKKLLNRQTLLDGFKALVTSGPTFEAIDPVRYIGNHSSGKQGHAIAESLANMGADVTLVTGPVSSHDPSGVKTIRVTTAIEMLRACEDTLNNNHHIDIAVCAAAVADWHITNRSEQKIKKSTRTSFPTLEFGENPDILKTIATHSNRPALVVGFAAETEKLLENAKAKRTHKKCDWIVANDVSQQENGEKTFGSDQNHVFLITEICDIEWPKTDKTKIASKLTNKIIEHFQNDTAKHSRAAK